MIRSLALTQTARGQPCAFAIPGVCNHDTETTVWCHSDEIRHGKGKGIKAHDVFGAFGCSACHAWYDHGQATRQARQDAFRDAFERTLVYLWSSGRIGVVAQTTRRANAARPVVKKSKGSTASSSKNLPRLYTC